MPRLTLYDFPYSGNGYKCRLLLALLALDYRLEPVDLARRAQDEPAFRVLNPRGEVPVLIDGEQVIWDSTAILTHLACSYGPEWMPLDTPTLTRLMQWHALAQHEILYGLAPARAHFLFNRPVDLAACQARGRAALAMLEAHLADHAWLVGERPSVADIACYPYVAMAPMGQVSLAPYPQVQAWCARMQTLPGYIALPGRP